MSMHFQRSLFLWLCFTGTMFATTSNKGSNNELNKRKTYIRSQTQRQFKQNQQQQRQRRRQEQIPTPHRQRARNALTGILRDRLKNRRNKPEKTTDCGPLTYKGTISNIPSTTTSTVACGENDAPHQWDWWKIELQADTSYTIAVNRITCALDPALGFYSGIPPDSDGSEVKCTVPAFPSQSDIMVGTLTNIAAADDEGGRPDRCSEDPNSPNGDPILQIKPTATDIYSLAVVEYFSDYVDCSIGYDYELVIEISNSTIDNTIPPTTTPGVHECESRDGVVIKQIGMASCSSVVSASSDCSNVAIAEGRNSKAVAGTDAATDSCNSATATGTEAVAEVSGGSNNVILAKGNSTTAKVTSGSNNFVTAQGTSATGTTTSNDNTIVLAQGDFAEAFAQGSGSNNQVKAIGNHTTARVLQGKSNIALARANRATIRISSGDSNTVTAETMETSATVNGDSNEVIARGISSKLTINGQKNRITTTGVESNLNINGDNNTATVDANDCNLFLFGNGNTATIEGDATRSLIQANGDDNTLWIQDGGSVDARVNAFGNSNRIFASGKSADAEVNNNGNSNSVLASGDGAEARVYEGSNNIVRAIGNNAIAEITNESNRTVIVVVE